MHDITPAACKATLTYMWVNQNQNTGSNFDHSTTTKTEVGIGTHAPHVRKVAGPVSLASSEDSEEWHCHRSSDVGDTYFLSYIRSPHSHVIGLSWP